MNKTSVLGLLALLISEGAFGSLWLRVMFLSGLSECFDEGLLRNWCMLPILIGTISLLGWSGIGESSRSLLLKGKRELTLPVAVWAILVILISGAITNWWRLASGGGLLFALFNTIPFPVCWMVALSRYQYSDASGIKSLYLLGYTMLYFAQFIIASLCMAVLLYFLLGGLGQDEMFVVVAVPIIVLIAGGMGVFGWLLVSLSRRLSWLWLFRRF